MEKQGEELDTALPATTLYNKRSETMKPTSCRILAQKTLIWELGSNIWVTFMNLLSSVQRG